MVKLADIFHKYVELMEEKHYFCLLLEIQCLLEPAEPLCLELKEVNSSVKFPAGMIGNSLSIDVRTPPGSTFVHLPLLLSQNITPLAAPDHQGDHGQCEENGDEDEDGQRVFGRVHPHHLVHGAYAHVKTQSWTSFVIRARAGAQIQGNSQLYKQ
ncbi:hypothetical protein EYF80_032196 [Liparis tanakae]|uniref:Uncharacterized protein n=1 Tax=Liparis tanakae TaxID=230148 RepID=A0A4Z2GYA8_9TELE|nr:hypothetical protein EYF80_032196 [Liparis tanakae]